MFRASAILPILLSIAGFILSLLVLLAGRDTKFLTDVFVLRIDTTNLGNNLDLDSLRSRFGIDETPTNIDFIDDVINDVSDDAEDAIGQVINTAAHELGLQDRYTAHVMTYCVGVVTGSATDNSTTVTGCTKPEIPFAFDPIAILEQDLLNGITLEDLNFPTEEIDAVVGALQTAYKAQSVCYVIGIALAGLSILLGLLGFASSRILEVLNSIVAFFGFLFLGIASAIATAIAIKARDVFNEKAQDIGVYAYQSNKFLGMTWGSVAAMLLASLIWGAICCCGGHRRRSSVDEGPLVSEKPRRRGRYW